MQLYNVFTRTWYDAKGRPKAGRKSYRARGVTYEAALDHCRVYNANHAPGKRSLKCEFERAE